MPGEMGFSTGPYITTAVFCEKVLEGKDGVLSLIRIVDEYTLNAAGPDIPDELPEGVATIQTTLVLMLKPGEAKGRQKVRIVIEHPNGLRQPIGNEMSVHFTGGPNNGSNLLVNLAIRLSSAGLYWFDVLVNDRLMTRVPLQVKYTPTRLSTP